VATSFVIEADRLIDGTGAAAVASGAVWVEGERVAWCGPIAELPAAAAGAERVRLPGASLLPGLVDAHVHLVASGGPVLSDAAAASPADRMVQTVANGHRHLGAGVTLVRDLGAPADEAIALGRAVDSATLAGPRVRAAGRALTITGGHIHYLGRQCDGADDVRRAVRENLALGATCIKVVATGGVTSQGIDPREAAFTQPELDAAVDEAHRLGLRVAAHAIGGGGVLSALRADVDSIEHGFFLDDASIALFLETGARLVPTFSPVQGILEGDAAPWVRERLVPAAAQQRASFAAAVSAGVRIAAGTDAGTPGNFHGHLAREVAAMVDGGLDSMLAIRAATAEAADLLDDQERGVVRVGAVADLLAVDGDPTVDITALGRPMATWQSGRPVTLHEPRSI
jgi:imidazolonepropionase-like amidohydrolase